MPGGGEGKDWRLGPSWRHVLKGALTPRFLYIFWPIGGYTYTLKNCSFVQFFPFRLMGLAAG